MDISVDEETKIEDITDNLYYRIQTEAERILKEQFHLLGVNTNNIKELQESGDFQKILHQGDMKRLATYLYKGQPILGVKISDNSMGIEFEIPNLKTED